MRGIGDGVREEGPFNTNAFDRKEERVRCSDGMVVTRQGAIPHTVADA